jgi:hypothetical protein
MNFISFFWPHFPGAPRREAAAPKASGCFMGGTCDVRGEPGKQNTLPGAGIVPSSAQENVRQKKDSLLKSVRIARKSTVAETGRVKRCEGALYGRLREHSGEIKQC